MRIGILFLKIAVILVVLSSYAFIPARLSAQDSAILCTVEIDLTKRNDIDDARTACDEIAKTEGFSLGVVRPLGSIEDPGRIAVCKICETDNCRDWICVGVGPPAPQVDSQFGIFTIVSTTRIRLNAAGATEPPPDRLSVTVVDVAHPDDPAFHTYSPDDLEASVITYVLTEGATPLRGACTVAFAAFVDTFILLDNFCFR